MPSTTYYGPNTTVSESCLWISEGSRRICITYTYNTSTGILQYAASIFRCKKPTWAHVHNTNFYIEPETSQMMAHAHTTTRRFEIRPVIIQVSTMLNYDQILKTIRREMCHGYGCKGPRNLGRSFNMDCASSDGGSESSANTWLSADEGEHEDPDYEPEFELTDEDYHKIQRKTTRTLRYISHGNTERYQGRRTQVVREFFIAFRADKKTGNLLYAAAISRRPEDLGPITDKDLIDNHFKTAIARLDYRPVAMQVSEEFRDQLRSKPTHREDVMYEILDVIESRPGGKYLIRGDW